MCQTFLNKVFKRTDNSFEEFHYEKGQKAGVVAKVESGIQEQDFFFLNGRRESMLADCWG